MYEKCGLDRTAAENLRTFIEDQLAATGCLPGDGRIICEHFSDETGDRRIVIHTPFGGRVHAPLAVVLHSKLSRLLNCRIEYIYNNDGILFHIFGYTGKLSNIFSLLDKNALKMRYLNSCQGLHVQYKSQVQSYPVIPCGHEWLRKKESFMDTAPQVR